MRKHDEVSTQTGAATLGQSVVIKGTVTAHEDLTLEGQVEGTIESNGHSVTIGQRATARAEILAEEVVVLGRVNGNIHARHKVEIWPNGMVEGDMVSPTVTIAEGATFCGSIDMTPAPAPESLAVAEAPGTEARAPRRLEIELPTDGGDLPQPSETAESVDGIYAA